MFEYFFKNEKVFEKKKDSPSRWKKVGGTGKQTVFLAIDKNSMNPMGVFDTFEEAKTNAEKITYHNCMIFKFVINDNCKYLINPEFESK
jgi:hypothetical protein